MKKNFKDIDLSFKKHPITGDLMVKYDGNSIKQAISNLIKTNFTERLNPNIGTNLNALLFKNNNVVSMYISKKELVDMVERYEPRAKVLDVVINVRDDSYYVNLIILVRDINKQESVEIILDKVL